MAYIFSTIYLTSKESSEQFDKTRIEAEKFLAETQGISESSTIDLTGKETELEKEIRESLEAIREDEAKESSKQSSSMVVPSPAPKEIVLENCIKMLWSNVYVMLMDKKYVDDNKFEK